MTARATCSSSARASPASPRRATWPPGGADVEVLEARDRPGGRVERVVLDDGRSVQMGGEVVGSFHTAYLQLAGELGLALEPSYVAEPGAMSWDLDEGPGAGPWPPFFTAADEDGRRARGGGAGGARPDGRSRRPVVAPRRRGARRDLARRLAARARARGRPWSGCTSWARSRSPAGSIERQSLLGVLRMVAVAGAEETYGYERWEGLRLADGSAALALAMADELGAERLRLDARRRGAVASRPAACSVAARRRRGAVGRGGRLRAAGRAAARRDGHAACPTGGWPASTVSARRWRPRSSRPIRARSGATPGAAGSPTARASLGSTWPQGNDALSMLVPPERLAAFLATPPAALRDTILDRLAGLYGDAAREPDALLTRAWGVDPFTQGYVSQWAPGDVMAVGPLHGTHEPPFYVAGSDHWVAGYMEGAVRTGRAAAAAALGRGRGRAVARA